MRDMNKYLNIVLFGFLVWLIPFIVYFIIFGLCGEYRPLFESIMAITVTLSVLIFSTCYLKSVDTDYIREGVIIGII